MWVKCECFIGFLFNFTLASCALTVLVLIDVKTFGVPCAF